MLQAILKDGRKMRFIGGVPKEYEPQIEYIIDIPDNDIHKVPEIVDGKLTLREKTQAELGIAQVTKDAKKAKIDKENLIQDKIRKIAIKELEKEGKL